MQTEGPYLRKNCKSYHDLPCTGPVKTCSFAAWQLPKCVLLSILLHWLSSHWGWGYMGVNVHLKSRNCSLLVLFTIILSFFWSLFSPEDLVSNALPVQGWKSSFTVPLDEWQCHLQDYRTPFPLLQRELGTKLMTLNTNRQKRTFQLTGFLAGSTGIYLNLSNQHFQFSTWTLQFL